MVNTIISKSSIFLYNFLLDVSLIGFIVKINIISDVDLLLKLLTTIAVLVLTIFRIVYFIKDRKRQIEERNKNR